MRHALERVLTGIALLIMPLVGLAASAHQAEKGLGLMAVLFAAVAAIATVLLARAFWRLHRRHRLHRAS